MLDVVLELMALLGLVGNAVGSGFVCLVVAEGPGLATFGAVLLVGLPWEVLLPGFLGSFLLLTFIILIQEVVCAIEIFSHQI